MLIPFRNEPFTDFSRPAERQAFTEALARAEAQLGQTYPLIIAGERRLTSEHLVSLNPCNTGQVIGRAAMGCKADAQAALEAAQAAFAGWSRTEPRARARILLRAAAAMRSEKHDLSAWMVLEAGKTWAEADADTAEAIDFLEYYAREMMRLAEGAPVAGFPGEENELFYVPMGVGAIITPWNFPLAILAGMTTAAVVTGNTVVLKPAEQTPTIAFKFMEIMEAAGLPPGVINLLTGEGHVVGEYLVDSPLTHFISFTGSRPVGCRIYERAARVQPGQRWLKRVVAELGGKDAIVVDADADLEAAAEGIVRSAFGFQGQKCSACSRTIVVGDAYGPVLARVVELTRALTLGPARDPETQVAAVSDQEQYEKVLRYIEIGKQEGRLLTGGEPFAATTPGYFIRPTVFADLDPQTRLMQEEIFGPVVGFTRAASFAEALEMANATDYGLTGGVYSRNRAHLELARREFQVGNLYFNRKCTGALVGVQPFGGFKMSGTDSKAGGPDYLLNFLQGKSVTEQL